MIVGLFKKNETDKKNMNIKNINNIIDKLGKTQNIKVNFIFFGYKNGLILQYVLLDIKADPLSLNSLPADNFFLYRVFIQMENISKKVSCKNKEKLVQAFKSIRNGNCFFFFLFFHQKFNCVFLYFGIFYDDFINI